MAAIYRTADAVVAYGPHVAAFARRHGARRVHVAPQAVDNAWWGEGAAPAAPAARSRALFAGRDAPEKGRDVLLDAWRVAGLHGSDAALVLAGGEAGGGLAAPRRRRSWPASARRPPQLRNLYGARGRSGRAVGRLPALSRAVGAGRQRGHEPAPRHRRHRRRRRRRRRPRARRASTASSCRRATPSRWPRALRRLHERRRVARAPRRHAARDDVQAYTFDAWAAGFAAARRMRGAPC